MKSFEDFHKELVSDERWYEIPGYEGQYQVSDYGQVKRVSHFIDRVSVSGRSYKAKHTEMILRPWSSEGYLSVSLKGKVHSVHRLVAICMLPNPENYPCVNHIDHNPSNNYVINLEWCTYKQNMQHALKAGRMKLNTLKLTETNVREIKSLPRSISSSKIGSMFNVSSSVIRHIRQGIIWKHVQL